MSNQKYLRFEWNEAKQQSNIRKHRVTFDEAKSAFSDPNARLKVSLEHGNDAYRFILMGISQKLQLLVVVHTYLDSDQTVRIISARKATTTERFQYRGFL